MAGFDRYIAVDWSARAKPAPIRPSKDAIWIASGHEAFYCRTREDAEGVLTALLAGSDRVLAGFDFAFAYPRWAMKRLGGWRAAWALIERLEREGLDRFEIARRLNGRLRVEAFWGMEVGGKMPQREIAEKRVCEIKQPRVQSPFKLRGIGCVGSQTLTGIPVLERLRRKFGAKVWPFEDVSQARVVLAEVWPPLAKEGRGTLPDERQVRGLVRKMREWSLEVPPVWRAVAREEGWILGVPFDHEPPEVSEHRSGSAAARKPSREHA